LSNDQGGFNAPPPPPPPSAGGGGPLPARGVGDILTAAFDVYKTHAAKLIVIVAIVVVPLSLIAALIVRVALHAKNTTTVTITGQRITTVANVSTVALLIGTLVSLALAFIMAFVVEAAVARAAAQATIGDTVVTEESYRWGFRRFGSVLLIALLVGIAIFVGLLLLIIPGIIAAVMLAVAIPALVFEDKRGMEALRRSWALVKGQFWHVLGTVFLTSLITGFVSSILDAFGRSNWVLYWIFDVVARIITIPFTAIVLIVLYLDLRARKESLTADTLRSELARSA